MLMAKTQKYVILTFNFLKTKINIVTCSFLFSSKLNTVGLKDEQNSHPETVVLKGL